jgi:hypothetical protein
VEADASLTLVRAEIGVVSFPGTQIVPAALCGRSISKPLPYVPVNFPGLKLVNLLRAPATLLEQASIQRSHPSWRHAKISLKPGNNRRIWRSAPTWRLATLLGRLGEPANLSERKRQCARSKKSHFALRLFSARLLRLRQLPLLPTHLEAPTSSVMAANRHPLDVYRIVGSGCKGKAVSQQRP